MAVRKNDSVVGGWDLTNKNVGYIRNKTKVLGKYTINYS